MYNFLIKNSTILYANIFTILIITIYSITFYDLAYLITFIILYALFIVLILYSKSNEKLAIFSILLPVYIVLSFLIAIDYQINIGVPYGYADESLFYYLGFFNHLDMLPSNFRFIAAPVKYMGLIDFTAYFELLKLQGDFYHYIGYQSFMAFKLISVFTGIIGIIVFYEICNQFLSKEESKKIVLLFGLLPLVAYQSSVLMRDIMIFSLSLYVVLLLLTISKRNFLLLIGTLSLIFLFRPENGLFMIASSSIFLFFTLIHQRLRPSLIIVISIIFLIIFLFLFKEQISYLLESLNNVQGGYAQRAVNSAGSSSLALKLKSLPFPVNNISGFLVSQISPFPFWALVRESYSPIIEGIGGLLWFFVWPFTIMALVKKEIREKINTKLFLIFLIFLLYIFLVANVQPMHRRLMVGYPFIWLIAYYGYVYTSAKERKILLFSTIMLLIIMYILYLSLKGL